jgi:hypothetical protein
LILPRLALPPGRYSSSEMHSVSRDLPPPSPPRQKQYATCLKPAQHAGRFCGRRRPMASSGFVSAMTASASPAPTELRATAAVPSDSASSTHLSASSTPLPSGPVPAPSSPPSSPSITCRKPTGQSLPASFLSPKARRSFTRNPRRKTGIRCSGCLSW